MESKFKRLPAGAEFAIVVVLVFGWFIFSSLHSYFLGHWVVRTSNAGKLHLIAFELVVMAVAGAFLYARGWTLERIGLRITLKDTAIGVGMGVGLFLFIHGVWYAASTVAPTLTRAAHSVRADASQMSLGVIIAVLVVNSVYEEVFASGYVVTFLKDRFGATLAVNASVFIRLLYHLYQGVGAVLSIVPIGLVFAIWYVRTRRLWPLIVAHACLNVPVYLRFIHW